MKSDELPQFLKDNVEPLKDPIRGNRYRAAAHLIDGTYLPCVVFESRQARMELALRRFSEAVKDDAMYRTVVESSLLAVPASRIITSATLNYLLLLGPSNL